MRKEFGETRRAAYRVDSRDKENGRMAMDPSPTLLHHDTIGEERDGGMRNVQAALRADVWQQLGIGRQLDVSSSSTGIFYSK